MKIGYMLLVEKATCECLNSSLCLKLNSKFSPIEVWSIDAEDDTVNMKIAGPDLYQYQEYPELFIVDSDFCTKN